MQGFPLFAARKRSMLLRMVVLVLPVVFMVTLLSQTVLAQNTFVITDGDDVIVHTSYATDPAEALTEAGIDVDQDEYSATQNEEGGYDITVQRNDAVTVTCGGQTQQVRIEDATVADLLTDGCDMGIKSLYRYLNQYKDAEQEATSIAKRLIDIEAKLETELRKYL